MLGIDRKERADDLRLSGRDLFRGTVDETVVFQFYKTGYRLPSCRGNNQLARLAISYKIVHP